jgi:hypothetical protein
MPTPEGDPIAMKIFLLLNGMGVLFLVYVLIQFWKEEHRTKCEVESRLRTKLDLDIAHPMH